jgi:hypothetical protein
MRVSILAAAERLKSSKELVITNSYPDEFYTVTAAKATSSVFGLGQKYLALKEQQIDTLSMYSLPQTNFNQSIDSLRIVPSII